MVLCVRPCGVCAQCSHNVLNLLSTLLPFWHMFLYRFFFFHVQLTAAWKKENPKIRERNVVPVLSLNVLHCVATWNRFQVGGNLQLQMASTFFPFKITALFDIFPCSTLMSHDMENLHSIWEAFILYTKSDQIAEPKELICKLLQYTIYNHTCPTLKTFYFLKCNAVVVFFKSDSKVVKILLAQLCF